MAHHIALVEISPRPWTAGICFAASQVERRPILFTGSHLCVQETWWFWWDSDLHMETKKQPQRLQPNPFEKKQKKKTRSALNLLLFFSKKNIYHFLVHFTVELRAFFGEALATPWAKAPQLARTAKLGISLETTWLFGAEIARPPGGGAVGRRILGGIFPMGWFIRMGSKWISGILGSHARLGGNNESHGFVDFFGDHPSGCKWSITMVSRSHK